MKEGFLLFLFFFVLKLKEEEKEMDVRMDPVGEIRKEDKDEIKAFLMEILEDERLNLDLHFDPPGVLMNYFIWINRERRSIISGYWEVSIFSYYLSMPYSHPNERMLLKDKFAILWAIAHAFGFGEDEEVMDRFVEVGSRLGLSPTRFEGIESKMETNEGEEIEKLAISKEGKMAAFVEGEWYFGDGSLAPVHSTTQNGWTILEF